jgi:hypothetical protein
LTKRILGELGKALGLNPGVLRLNDTFDQLFGLDTWNSGHGQDVFEEWLTKEFGKLDRTEKPRTIGELVKMLQIRGDSANPISKQNADEKSQRPKEY